VNNHIDVKLLTSICLMLVGAHSVMAETNIWVSKEGWGDGRPDDIRVLLNSVAAQFESHCQGLTWPGISVFHCEPLPITLDQHDAEGRVRIGLNTRDRPWCQYSFQFGHELVHLIAGHLAVERRWSGIHNPVGWFEESLCEAGSLFALRAMTRDWEARAPFPNWVPYRKELWKYAQERMDLPENNLPNGQTFSEWLKLNEEHLRGDCYNRQANCIVARQVLPVFEQHPEGWKAVTYLRASKAGPEALLEPHLLGWRDACPDELRPFVTSLAEALGLSLTKLPTEQVDKKRLTGGGEVGL
jgi:hypothetical protein